MGLEANLTSPYCFPQVSQGFSHVSFSDCVGGATLQNWDLRTGCAVKGATVMIHYIYDIMTIPIGSMYAAIYGNMNPINIPESC